MKVNFLSEATRTNIFANFLHENLILRWLFLMLISFSFTARLAAQDYTILFPTTYVNTNSYSEGGYTISSTPANMDIQHQLYTYSNLTLSLTRSGTNFTFYSIDFPNLSGQGVTIRLQAKKSGVNVGSPIFASATGTLYGTTDFINIDQVVINYSAGTNSIQIDNVNLDAVLPGAALNFDGSNDHVNCTNAASFQITTGTIEAWIKTSNAGASYRGIVVKQLAYGLFLVDNELMAYDWTGGGNMATGITLNDNIWHHVAFTFNHGVANGSKIYIDGVLRATKTYSILNQTQSLGIGEGDIPLNNQPFNGSIDEVRVWNTYRTQAEISGNMSCEIPTTATGLIANYHFNQGFASAVNSGVTTLTDASGSGNNGTLTNFALTGASSNWVAPGGVTSGSSINTAGAASSTPTLCINTALTNITHATTGATGIGAATGLPAGVSAAWASNTITISGTPAASGTFNYSIPLTGGCGSVSATGTITVDPAPTTAAAGSDQTVCATTATLAGNTPSVGTGTWTKTSGTTTITTPSSPTSGITGLSGTAVLKWTISNGTCTSSFDEVSITSSIPTDQTVVASPSTICTGNSTTVTVGSSQAGVNYTLRDNADNSVVAGPTAGTGSSIDFNTGVLTANKTFNVFAEKSNTVSSGALDFDGVDDYASVPHSASLNVSAGGALTMEAFINPVGGAWENIIMKGSYGYGLALQPSNKIYFWDSGCGGCDVAASDVAVTPGQWSHVAVTIVDNGANLTVNYYLNGINVGTKTSTQPAINDNASSLIIGMQGTGCACNYFNGKLDELRVWNVVRTPAEISANMNASLIGNEAGLVAYYTFENGSGTTVTDIAGGDNNGTLTNMDNSDWVTRDMTTICSSQMAATPTVTVTPNNTAGSASSTPTLCINTSLTNITHATTGATGISNAGTPGANGLPAGVSATWASNTITISGTPTASGTFNYSIPLTGGCGTVNATGTITVTPANTAGTASSTPTLCINTALTDITHTTTGATGIGAATGLPAGVTAAWAADVITISGTPTASGTFNYSIPLTGGCGSVNATGTITVSPTSTVAAAGADQSVCGTTATLAGNTPTVGTGAWSLTSGTATITTPSSPASGITGLNGTAVLKWTISNGSCTSSFDEVSITDITPANQTVTASPSTICTGNSSTITVGSSETGVNYTLRDNSNNSVIAGPTAGTGTV